MGLHVLGAVSVPQVRDDLGFVARRQQRGQQDDVGHSRVTAGNGRVARVDDDQLGMDAVADDPLEDRGLPQVRLEGEDRAARDFSRLRLSA